MTTGSKMVSLAGTTTYLVTTTFFFGAYLTTTGAGVGATVSSINGYGDTTSVFGVSIVLTTVGTGNFCYGITS